MEPRGIFSMAVPAEVLAAALAEDGSRRSRPGTVPDGGGDPSSRSQCPYSVPEHP